MTQDPTTLIAPLHNACAALGTKLFTITTLDPARGVVWRSYTSHPVEYPAQGTKPLVEDDWHLNCIVRRIPFVANTPAEFEKVFFDHALITSMGLGSACNIAVADAADQVRMTVNLLAGAGHFTPEALAAYQALVAAHRPALLASLPA